VQWATWDQAAIAALISGSIAIALGRLQPNPISKHVRPPAQEFAFVATLYSIWRLARQLPLVHEAGALERARDIDRFQQWLHLPTELSVQHFVMAHDTLARWTVAYYAAVHVPSLLVFLVWLYFRHREAYPRWRTALCLLTGFCLVIRFIRVAPPRFLTELGFVDLSNVQGLSVYGPVGTGVSDQFAAMPSIHVAWAAVVSLGIVAAGTSRWRWLFLPHLFITIFVVAATGHHWWMDGIVALVLLAISFRIDTMGRRLGRRRRMQRSAPAAIELEASEPSPQLQLS
jgi:hypothetical protein